jgi:hypothetical protein
MNSGWKHAQYELKGTLFLLVGLRIRRPRFCEKQNKNKISDGHLKKKYFFLGGKKSI